MKKNIYFTIAVVISIVSLARSDSLPSQESKAFLTKISNNFNIKDQSMATSTNKTASLKKDTEKSLLISEDQAIDLARKAVGNSIKLQEKGEVKVELKGDQYIVTFVHKVLPGWRGAGYDAIVYLNVKTGHVEKVLGGP